jgi:hypothetical protein
VTYDVASSVYAYVSPEELYLDRKHTKNNLNTALAMTSVTSALRTLQATTSSVTDDRVGLLSGPRPAHVFISVASTIFLIVSCMPKHRFSKILVPCLMKRQRGCESMSCRIGVVLSATRIGVLYLLESEVPVKLSWFVNGEVN